jgi:3-hydroxyisobutyrate dehydrogenase
VSVQGRPPALARQRDQREGSLVSVGVVGVGAMGLPMAERLLDGGHEVWAHDIDTARLAAAAERGVHPAADAAAVAARVQVLVVAVVDAAQTEAVLFDAVHGAAPALAPGSSVLLCPTIGPQDVERFAATLAARGIGVLDAPMSGGPARARDGTMSLMVAGDDGVFARHEALLRHLASRLFRVSLRPGDGARAKLVNNLLAAINLAGASEAMALAVRMGLDPAATLAIVEASSGQSWIASDRLRRAIEGDPGVRARISLLAKDSALALAMDDGTAMPVARAAAAVFEQAVADGHGERDDSRLWTRAEPGP